MNNLHRRNIVEDTLSHKGDKTIRELGGLTVVHPFFNEPSRFELQLENWVAWSADAKANINLILVDDCSPSPVHTWITDEHLNKMRKLNLSIFRITTDLKFNTPGALNLAFTVAPTPFVLTMDSDCAFGPDHIDKFLDIAPRRDFVYMFRRRRVGTGKASLNNFGELTVENLANTRFLPCSLLLHKDLFNDLGGFDEDFTGERSGGYGFFDNDFMRRVESKYDWAVWSDVEALEWMPSMASGEIVVRSPDNERTNRALYRAKGSGEIPQNKDILRFEWERSFHHDRS